MSTFSRLFLIQSFLYLQVTRTCIKSRTSSNFSQIGPLTTELTALEVLKISHILIMGKWCLHASSFIFDRHKSSDEFDFGPLVSMAHLYVFWNEIWPWHIGLRWAIVALWATCFKGRCRLEILIINCMWAIVALWATCFKGRCRLEIFIINCMCYIQYHTCVKHR